MKQPNILIFNPDQWRGDVMGHLGHPAAVTPTLDGMVTEDAVSFASAFCQNPVCTPSRCSFMTGWYPHVRGHRTMHHMLRAEEPCLLEQLKRAGYFVWWGGKNDLVPAQHGYQRYCDIRYQPSLADYSRWGHRPAAGLHGVTDWRGDSGSDTYYSFYAGKLDTPGDSIYCDGDWANVLGAIDFIHAAPQDKPLCIYLPLEYPHPPYGVEEPWFSMIDRAKVPPRFTTTFADKPTILRGIHERQGLAGWTQERWTQLRATYYAMCARVDHQLGLIIQALRDTGIYDDTALFCFSDHGDFTGDYGLVEKTQNTFEDCLTRVPLIIKPPRGVRVQPRVSQAMVELVDVSATVYEIAGIDPGYSHFGRSLVNVLASEQVHRDAVFCEGGRLPHEMHCREGDQPPNPSWLYWPRLSLQWESSIAHGKAVMCRTQRYKYVRRLMETDEFYDLSSDPGETHNRINDPALANEVSRHRERLLTFFMQTADVVPHDADRRW